MLQIDLAAERAKVRQILAVRAEDIEDSEEGGDLAWLAMIGHHDLATHGKHEAAAQFSRRNAAHGEKRYNAPWSEEKKALFKAEWLADWTKEEIAVSFCNPEPHTLYQIAKRLGLPLRRAVTRNQFLPARRKETAERYRENRRASQSAFADLHARRKREVQALKLAIQDGERRQKKEERIAVRIARHRLKTEAIERLRAGKVLSRHLAKLARLVARIEGQIKRVAERKKHSADRKRLKALKMWESGITVYAIARRLQIKIRNGDIYRLLEQSGVKVEQRKRVWTADDDTILRELVSQGTSLDELRSALKRTAREIEARSAKLGLHEMSDLRFVSGMTKSLSRPHSHAPKRSQ